MQQRKHSRTGKHQRPERVDSTVEKSHDFFSRFAYSIAPAKEICSDAYGI
jgi:hypothetical protein